MIIEELGPRVASVWNHLRTTTRNLVERAWKSSAAGSVMQVPRPTPYDPRADHELSQLLAALDEHTTQAGLSGGGDEQSREARRLADACANVLTQQTQSAEVFAQLIERAHRRNDYARVDALAAMRVVDLCHVAIQDARLPNSEAGLGCSTSISRMPVGSRYTVRPES